MSAVYYLGAKSIKSKKSGKEYFPAKFLSLNSWGDWEIFTKFCASADVFTDVIDNIVIGAPVIVSLDMGGNVIQCVAHDSVPALPLPDSDL